MWLPVLASERVDIGRFSEKDISGWKQKTFVGETLYRIAEIDGNSVLEAESEQSASAFYHSIKVDLEKTPILNWSWRKQKAIRPVDESVKSGDDFVARVYVIKDGGMLFWKTRAINYVWSEQHTKQQVWDNPFAGKRAKMLAQRDASDARSKWFSERRNVVKDFKELHNLDIRSIDGVAIMTDSDNSGQSATAIYGDIYFSAE